VLFSDVVGQDFFLDVLRGGDQHFSVGVDPLENTTLNVYHCMISITSLSTADEQSSVCIAIIVARALCFCRQKSATELHEKLKPPGLQSHNCRGEVIKIIRRKE